MKITTGRNEAHKRFADWLSHEWGIAVFENHDLGSAMVGHRFAIPVDRSALDAAKIGESRAPDTALGLGWRYILIAKPGTPEEAVALVYRELGDAA